jgi:hypothetical protein
VIVIFYNTGTILLGGLIIYIPMSKRHPRSGTTTIDIASGRESREGIRRKRKYRRHPQHDENAPKRPSSAYVLFCNHVGQSSIRSLVSFTDIAKLCGEGWAALSAAEREPWESQAAKTKEAYTLSYLIYSKTENHRQYQIYVTEFRARQAKGEKTPNFKISAPCQSVSDSQESTSLNSSIPKKELDATEDSGHSFDDGINLETAQPLALK